ncbi:MAG: hypothetical protein WCV50_05955 [Patescibacteria group bacterium]|jgi:hypothetical protein
MADDKTTIEFLGASPVTEAALRYWDSIPEDTKAVIVETFGSGSIPSEFAAKIHATVLRGIPVFLLNGVENPVDEVNGEISMGITDIKYGVQQKALEAGAVHIEAVNIGHVRRSSESKSANPRDNVMEQVRVLAEQSQDMFELITKVREVYNLTDEEIQILEKQTRENAIPITREKILRARQSLDTMLVELKRELSERQAELHSELHHQKKL